MGEVITKGDLIAKKVQNRNKPDFHKNTTYTCELEDKQGLTYEGVYVARKKELSEGDELFGRIENNEYGYRFFAEQKDEARAPSSNGDRSEYKQQQVSNRAGSTDDAIRAQVAFKGAVEYAAARIAAGEPCGTDDVVGMTRKFATAIKEAQ